MTALLSVIIPVWCRPIKIRRAIASVASGPLIEVIVIDDGSPDDTAKAARDALADTGHQGRVLIQKKAGPGAARNYGASVAAGRYLAFLDSDDIWFSSTTQTLLDLLERTQTRGLIFLQHITFPENRPTSMLPDGRARIAPYAGFRDAALRAKDIRLGSGSCVIPAELFHGFGGFDVNLRASEDTDLFLKLPPDCGCDLLLGPPLIGIETGAEGQLTSDITEMLSGLRHLLTQARSKVYPQPSDPDLDRVLAQSVSYTIRKVFGAGQTKLAYELYFRHLPQLFRARAWHWTIRLPLIPILSALRPGRHALK